MTHNTLDLLACAFDRLAAAGVRVLIHGGWAEELVGLAPPRPHRDIDLLLPAPSFAALDRLLAESARTLPEIRAKRFAHKRAFTLESVAVEVTLVEDADGSPMTRFWGDVPFRWLAPLAMSELLAPTIRPFAVVSAANLVRYRALYATTQPWRWRDPGSLVD